MTNLCFEVIGGPMDGLTCVCKDNRNYSIIMEDAKKSQYKNDYTMNLSLDRYISTPQVNISFDNNWFIEDRNSTNGTFSDYNGHLLPNEKYLLENIQLILLGRSTIIKIYDDNCESESKSYIEDDHYLDPREKYGEKFSKSLRNVWDKIYSKRTPSKTMRFCDLEVLFQFLLDELGLKTESCIYEKFIPQKIKDIRFKYEYSFSKNSFLVSPKVWRIMDIASKITYEQISVEHLMLSIFIENRSFQAMYMKQDKFFYSFILNSLMKILSSYSADIDAILNSCYKFETNVIEYMIGTARGKKHVGYNKDIQSILKRNSNRNDMEKLFNYWSEVFVTIIAQYNESHDSMLSNCKDQIEHLSFSNRDFNRIARVLNNRNKLKQDFFTDLREKINVINEKYNIT